MKLKEAEHIRAQFLKDTADHEMTILMDGHTGGGELDIYRHVKFARPGSSVYRYDLVTWPGYLAVSGDMGEFIFSRVPDMFTFFRTPREREIEINPGYWGEKCRAGEVKEFSNDVFKQSIWDYFESWEEDEEDEDVIRTVKSQIQSGLGDFCNEWEAGEFVNDFQLKFAGRRDFYFQDWFDWVRTKDYCYHYIWILYAIAYGIRKYDEKL